MYNEVRASSKTYQEVAEASEAHLPMQNNVHQQLIYVFLQDNLGSCTDGGTSSTIIVYLCTWLHKLLKFEQHVTHQIDYHTAHHNYHTLRNHFK